MNIYYINIHYYSYFFSGNHKYLNFRNSFFYLNKMEELQKLQNSRKINSNVFSSSLIPKCFILVEPTNFKINEETITDNVYMPQQKFDQDFLKEKILNEHKNYQKELEKNKINYEVYKQVHEDAFDSIFACDWFGSIKNEDFPEGILFLFPMRWPTRRLERNQDIIDKLKKENKFFVDMTFFEEKNLSLESFGAMSVDFHNKIVYTNLSERCHIEPLNYFMEMLNKFSKNPDYKLRLIQGVDPKNNTPVFHTGLYLCFLNDTVLFCKDFVTDPVDAEKLVQEFTQNNSFKYNIILLSYEQIIAMCANVLEFIDTDLNKSYLIMSKMSYEGYSQEEIKMLKEKFNELLIVDMDYINRCAGGSLRCMTNYIY
jgi:hypothetical protein